MLLFYFLTPLALLNPMPCRKEEVSSSDDDDRPSVSRFHPSSSAAAAAAAAPENIFPFFLFAKLGGGGRKLSTLRTINFTTEEREG